MQVMDGSSGLAALIAHSLTRSVQKLQLAMNEVSKGDFDVQVDINTRDEIGELAEKFSWITKIIPLPM